MAVLSMTLNRSAFLGAVLGMTLKCLLLQPYPGDELFRTCRKKHVM